MAKTSDLEWILGRLDVIIKSEITSIEKVSHVVELVENCKQEIGLA
jgi:hypothetical protein